MSRTVVLHFTDVLTVVQLRFATHHVRISPDGYLNIHSLHLALYTNVTQGRIPEDGDLLNRIVFFTFVGLGVVFMFTGLSISIYRYRLSRSFHQHISHAQENETRTLFLQAY